MTHFEPGAFRERYTAFLRPDRVLLTGHSHQAWPDVALTAQQHYFDDAAEYVDTKWERAVLPAADTVRQGVLHRMGFPDTDALAFGQSTHELVFRLLSCFKWDRALRVVTTTSEFHSLHRQLNRLHQEGVDVVFVDARDRTSLPERLHAALTPGTTLLALSAVFFEDAYVLPELAGLLERAGQVGAHVLVDAYHAFNVVPLELGPAGDKAFVVAGGYKYAQFGEGVCWMRIPSDTQLQPVYTGWFADFDALDAPRNHQVHYGAGGQRFAGSTFDGSALYRANAVLTHFAEFGLDGPQLRAISLKQTGLLMDHLAQTGALDVAPLVTPRNPSRRGGFVALRHAQAAQAVPRLRSQGVWADARADLLRLGPAPYVTDAEITHAANTVAKVLRAL